MLSPCLSSFCFIDLILYIPISIFSVMLGRVFLGWTRTKQKIKCLAQGHNAVPLVRLEPATPQSRVKHSTTEPPRSSWPVLRGAQWFKDRVLHLRGDLRSRGCRFEPHCRHCVVSLSQKLYTLLSTDLTQETSWHDWKTVGRDFKH